jgi:hypothetical protein
MYQSTRSITGLDPVQDVMCETLDVSDFISIDGETPTSKQFLAFDPETQTTTYQDIDPARDIDINSLPELLSTTSNDELIIYDAATSLNKKISPENIGTTYQSGNGIAIDTSTDPDTISVIVDGVTITNDEDGDKLKVLKVPNVLQAGTNITMLDGLNPNSFDGSSSVTISSTDTNTTYQGSSTIQIDGATNPESLKVIKTPSPLRSGTNVTLTDTPSGMTVTRWDGDADVTISSTNTDTTYTAGTGLTLIGTQFNFTGGNIGSTSITTTGDEEKVHFGWVLAVGDGVRELVFALALFIQILSQGFQTRREKGSAIQKS